MFKNKVYLSSIFILALSIWGCGTMAKNDDTLSVPQKVSIDMPKALAVDASKSEKRVRLQKEDNSSKSAAYLALKDDVQFLEEQRTSLEINLLFINEIIADVDAKCKEVAVEASCIIEEYTLTFVFDDNLSNKVKALSSDDLGYEIGDTLTFGQIEFIEHLSSNKYRYTLKTDTTFGDENSTSSESIFWSKDESLILSEYIEESATLKNNINIDFSKKEDNSRQIVVDNSFLNKVDSSSDEFHFNMLKKEDVDETYELSSTSVATDSDANKDSFISVGKLSNLEGYLNFTGEFDGEVFKENDIFDGNGNVLSSSYCYSGMDCELEDEDSWFTF